jgi:hypothetical protein
VAAGPVFAQHPGRYLESRRASAPIVYLATVAEVRETGPADAATGTAARMEATLTPLKVYRPVAAPGTTPAAAPASAGGSPTPSPATGVVVRYEQAGKAADDIPPTVAYRLAVGDRVLVFASTFERAVPLEMVVGAPKAVAAQVAALRKNLLEMEESAAALHGVTPQVKSQQQALYDRVLADLGGSRAP